MTLPALVTMSKPAISPRRRSGTRSTDLAFGDQWKVSNSKKSRGSARVHADRLQQDRDRHLAAAVDAEIQVVLRIELEVEPRAAVGMIRAENSSLPELWVLPRSCSKNTPGERCSCETITRSVPLMTNEPVSS
jgi:hypothetical protein